LKERSIVNPPPNARSVTLTYSVRFERFTDTCGTPASRHVAEAHNVSKAVKRFSVGPPKAGWAQSRHAVKAPRERIRRIPNCKNLREMAALLPVALDAVRAERTNH
jgi:hypothetical protein